VDQQDRKYAVISISTAEGIIVKGTKFEVAFARLADFEKAEG
jgi:hypothetical protein